MADGGEGSENGFDLLGVAAEEAGGEFGGGEGSHFRLLGCGLGIAPLLRFEHERAAFVEIDAAGCGGAIGFVEGNISLEDIGVLGEIILRRFGAGNRA